MMTDNFNKNFTTFMYFTMFFGELSVLICTAFVWFAHFTMYTVPNLLHFIYD